MFEETRKYSEAVYISKKQLSLDYEGSVLEAVRQQIQEYRSLFYRTYHFVFFTGVICYCPSVMERLFRISVRLYNLPGKGQGIPHMEASLAQALKLLAQEERLSYHYDGFVRFLQNAQKPCLVRLFFLLAARLPESEHWVDLLLRQEGWDVLLPYVKEVSVVLEEKDATICLLAFCAGIEDWLAAFERTNSQSAVQTAQLRELVLAYPALNSRQLRFYVDHRKAGCYYTIRQYKEACGVCYETARRAMEELTAMGWYQRCKVGKKFVYRSV